MFLTWFKFLDVFGALVYSKKVPRNSSTRDGSGDRSRNFCGRLRQFLKKVPGTDRQDPFHRVSKPKALLRIKNHLHLRSAKRLNAFVEPRAILKKHHGKRRFLFVPVE